MGSCTTILELFSGFATPYCVSFVLLVQFCMMNLVVDVVLNDLETEVAKKNKMTTTGLKVWLYTRISIKTLKEQLFTQ